MFPSDLRPLGTTATVVTPFGLGTGPLGGWPTAIAEQDARATIAHALDGGIRLFDTAPLYGHGSAERHLGAVLRERPRDSYVVTTKVGRLLRRGAPLDPSITIDGRSLFAGEHEANPVFDFSYDATLRSLEESLERLGLDRVDAAYIHDPDEHFDQALDGAYVALDRMRSEGVIDAVGAGMNQVEMLARFARAARFDCFLLAGRYTLLEQTALDDLIPVCAAQGISLVIGGVFNSGLLVDPSPSSTYDYAPAPPEVVEHALRLKRVCDRHGVPLAAAALQFAAAQPVVATVLMGTRSPAELDANARLVALPIPSDLWAELKDEGLLRTDAPVPETTTVGS
jgi:D-threo-aldose 1-dehydrogenase